MVLNQDKIQCGKKKISQGVFRIFININKQRHKEVNSNCIFEVGRGLRHRIDS
jgi:hypothetical protein